MELLRRSDVVLTNYHGESEHPDRISLRGGPVDRYSHIASDADKSGESASLEKLRIAANSQAERMHYLPEIIR
jgi:hypothetical protein